MQHETMQNPQSPSTDWAVRSRVIDLRDAEKDRDRFIRDAIAAHGSAVLGVATRVLRDPNLAEDVAQDTFVAFWRQRDRIDLERGSVRGLLCSIARNKAIDLVRREEVQRRAREAAEATTPTLAPDAYRSVDDRTTVMGALKDLTQLQREAIELAYFGGRTYREVAQELNIPEGTAKTRLRDALLAMRTALTPSAPL